MQQNDPGPDWWLADDGNYYPPPMPEPEPAPTPGPDWWLADDGNYYPPPMPEPAPPAVVSDSGLPFLQAPTASDPSVPTVFSTPPVGAPLQPSLPGQAPLPPPLPGPLPGQAHTAPPLQTQPQPEPNAWGAPDANPHGWQRPTSPQSTGMAQPGAWGGQGYGQGAVAPAGYAPPGPPEKASLASRMGCGARIRGVFVGILWIILGIVITSVTAALGFSIYFVAYGPMIYGVIVIFRSMFSRNP